MVNNSSTIRHEPPVKPIDPAIFLANIDDDEVRSLLPLILFYATILSIGVIGNALVLLVYTFRYKRSPARVFILFLASIDFSICLFGLPYHLIDLTHPYTFTNGIACKLLTFVITTLFHMSVFGLIVIAIDRYLKICMPLSHLQLSFFKKKRACIGAVVAAILFSWPNLVLYGPSEMETSFENVTGYACYYETQYLETNYPLIYTVTVLCVCISCTVFLIVAYSLIYIQIYKRYYGMRRAKVSKLTTEPTCTEDVMLRPVVTERRMDSPDHQIYQTAAANSNNLGNCVGPYLIESNYRSQKRSHQTSESTDMTKMKTNLPNKNICNHDIIGEKIKDIYAEVSDQNNSRQLKKQRLNVDERSRSMENIHLLIADTEHEECLQNHKQQLNKDGASSVGIPACSDIMKPCDNMANGLNICIECTTSSLHNACNNTRADSIPKCPSPNCKSESEQSTGGISKPSAHGGFPMCIPQRVKRRSLDHPRSRPSLRHTKQKSISLANLPRNCLNLVNECEGLRIHTSSTASMYTAASNNQTKHNQGKHSKITKIMLTITVVFILSYSPALIVTILSVVKPDIWDIMSVQETIICEFFLRLYLVNNVCNPFIYGFWDKRFLREIRFSFKKLFQRIKDLCCCERD